MLGLPEDGRDGGFGGSLELWGRWSGQAGRFALCDSRLLRFTYEIMIRASHNKDLHRGAVYWALDIEYNFYRHTKD
jgi:hypothetical protein